LASAQVNIAQTPLFLSSSAEPNIMFILDDSGSMHWEITPDDFVLPYFVFRRISGLYGAGDYLNYVASVRYDSGNFDERTTARALRSPTINRSYYNPAVTYRPWSRADGTLFPNASPTAAPHHPIRTGLGTRNLTVNTTESAIWVHRNTAGGAFCSVSCAENALTHYPAVYFRHNGGAVWDAANYTRVNIISTTATYTGDGRTSRTDAGCSGGTCTYAAEIQNFANWYTYYRSRMLAAQAGIGSAFAEQPEEMRVGFGAINKGATVVDGQAGTSTIIRGVRPFSGTNRTGFFTSLYEGNWDPANTPLRKALDDAGQYFSRSDNLGPWGAVPGTNNTTNQLTCRQSYTILMTDGYWNDAAAATAAARSNVDGSAGATITGPGGQSYTYSAVTPFTDGHADTLADIAMYYWNRDLRPDLDNLVPTSTANPAFWQHMVTYGVGLGVTGSINPQTALNAITASPPPTITWPNPTSSNAAKLDDLLHAAVNSRGGFFSAADPETFANELSSVLRSIVARVTGAGTAAAASSALLQADTLLYNAIFRSSDWSGTLVARELDEDTGEPAATVSWDAEQRLAARDPATRNIFTRTDAGTAVALDFGNLGAAQQTALGINPPGAPASSATGTNRVNWLRGTDHAQLRNRVVDGQIRRMGDIIGSDPQFLSKRDYGYSLLPGAEGTSYRTFRNSATYRNRPDALLLGTNGGMFHAFHATTGEELFAFVPSELLLPVGSNTHAQINELMRSDYDHRFFVDGSATLSDVYTGGSWRTIVVGTMGAGGRTVFALDVTNPGSFSAGRVLWEFKYANTACTADPAGASGSRACRDIGFGVTKPKIVRLDNGRWAAVFGNGYNSNGHRARLMAVDIATGRLLYNVIMPDGASAATPNGMGPPETTDWPANDLSLANVYSGDLLGNVWRVNLRTATPTVTRLHSALDSSGARQPITARPRVALKPGTASDVVVLFGTGSFFRVGDDSTVAPQVQTLYGIFDTAGTAVTDVLRSELRSQTITTNGSVVIIGGTSFPAGSLRYVTANDLEDDDKGWRIDLPVSGERVISEATFPTGAVQRRVRFTTLIPDDDPCGSGRQGFLMDIDLLSGGRYTSPVFDLSGDGAFDNSDAPGGTPPSGIGGPTGEPLVPVRDPNSNKEGLYQGDGNKLVDGSNESGPAGRQSWRQLR